MILMPQTETANIEQILNRIRIKVAQHQFQTQQGPRNLTVSIGALSGIPQAKLTGSFSQCLQAADVALYQVKNSGRNQVIVHKWLSSTVN